MKSLTTLFLALVFSLNTFADTVSDKEKEALLKFYHATNGSQWKIKWDLSLSISTWYGVEIENGKVAGLNLPDNNLQGELPLEFFDLVNLERIDLHKNKLAGTLPNAVSGFKELEVLDISSNKISGQLPLNFGNLKKLEILSLFDNEIEGQLPSSIYTITTLKVLL